MREYAPSILTADYAAMGEELELLKRHGIKWLHLDVMDGVFVPNISFGFAMIKSLRETSDLFFDVHLMIVEPERYIERFADSGADLITFHVEATKDPKAVIDQIHACGKKAGISLRPGTDLSKIRPFLSDLDLVLVMSVEPGFGGQSFIPEMQDRIRELCAIREEEGLNYLIEVDGGIHDGNAAEVFDTGADILIAGSCVFKGSLAEHEERLIRMLSLI